MFKVGDVIRCTNERAYGITTPDAICKVLTDESEGGTIEVMILYHLEGYYTSGSYTVNASHFALEDGKWYCALLHDDIIKIYSTIITTRGIALDPTAKMSEVKYVADKKVLHEKIWNTILQNNVKGLSGFDKFDDVEVTPLDLTYPRTAAWCGMLGTIEEPILLYVNDKFFVTQKPVLEED